VDQCEIVSSARVNTDAGIELMSKRKDVRALAIGNFLDTSTDPRVTDEGLARVARMAALEQLDVYSRAITDSGLWRLRDLIALRKLHIKGPQVTEEGVARLREVLTACEIIWIPTSRSLKTPQTAQRGRPVGQEKVRQGVKQKAAEARAAKQRRLAQERDITVRRKVSAVQRKAVRRGED
jgi:hypothetical protein